MKSVKYNENVIIIKNSKFITRIYPINNKLEIDKYLKEIKEIYKDATHYCYAYIIDGNIKSSDDGEPNSTAGIPILNVLQKNNLNYVLCIVIRYFGKIKLGRGGLVRAYTKSVSECLKNNIIELSSGFIITITFPYFLQKEVDYLIKDEKILTKIYNKEINYQIQIKKEKLKELLNHKNLKITINQKIYL